MKKLIKNENNSCITKSKETITAKHLERQKLTNILRETETDKQLGRKTTKVWKIHTYKLPTSRLTVETCTQRVLKTKIEKWSALCSLVIEINK